MSIIAIIPAKTNSRRLPNKNFLKLGNKKIFQYAVDCALKSKLIKKIILSSDSKDLEKYCKKKKIYFHLRSKKLCTSSATNFDVIKDIYKNFKFKIKIFVLLQPTQPFRRSYEIDKAIKLFKFSKYSSLITVKKKTIGKKKIENTGHLYLLNIKKTLSIDSFFGNNICKMLLPENWVDIDIDTLKDYNKAKKINAKYSYI